ncbi:hypothetical protein NN561_001091 [Cricetulus griseus]
MCFSLAWCWSRTHPHSAGYHVVGTKSTSSDLSSGYTPAPQASGNRDPQIQQKPLWETRVCYPYSTHEAPGVWRCLGPLHRATFPLDSRPGLFAVPRPRPRRQGSPEKPERGDPEPAGAASAQRTGRASAPRERRPRSHPAQPPGPGRSAPGYLRAAGGGWRLCSLLARGRLGHSDLGPCTLCLPRTRLRPHHKGPETGQHTGLQFLLRHHRGARTRNRARAAAQVMLRPVSSAGVGAREACVSRRPPAAGSRCRETRRRVLSARLHRCPSFNVWVFNRPVLTSFPPESKMDASGFRQVR